MPTWMLLPRLEALALGTLLERSSEGPSSGLRHTIAPLLWVSVSHMIWSPLSIHHQPTCWELAPSAFLPLNGCVTLGNLINHLVPQLSVLQKWS